MAERRHRRWPWFLGFMVFAVLLVLLWLYAQLRASLPILDGKLTLAGLSAPVLIERDALGVPTIHAENRIDASRALGFLHGQERFFQMDLLRRSAAGELAELFGTEALDYDQRIRWHRFRRRAQALIENLSAADAKLAQAYTDGVNAGLSALGEFPFEYLLIGSEPRPWQVADTALAVFAMYLDLQDETARYEATLDTLFQLLPESVAAFFAPVGTEWDAPLQGEAMIQAPVPAPELFDLRHLSRDLPASTKSIAVDTVALGSNNWAVSGRLTQNGAALLANDMHLGLRVPNIWYRARLIYKNADDQERSLVGVTLPGTPAIVAGSNGAIAWGFTNSYGDWSDRVAFEPAGEGHYLTPQGPESYRLQQEIIAVKGDQPQLMEILETRWGPVLPIEYEGQTSRYAISWVAHYPQAVNLELLQLENAESIEQALEIAQRSGGPAQNIIVAGKQGHIGWTVAGPIPRRQGFDGRLPVSWASGAGWDSWLKPDEYPRIVDPSGGILWTANARVVEGEDLAKIGDGAYALGARAKQIRDDLRALQQADEDTLLTIQLDDRALFLRRWGDLLLATLDEQALADIPERRELRDLVRSWNGKASTNAVGYRLLRAFREQVWSLTFAPLQAYLRQFDPSFDYGLIRQSEGPLWTLLQARPQHYLPVSFQSWRELQLAAADRVISELSAEGTLSERTWGERNTLRMQHPFSQVAPWPLSGLVYWLDMPAEPLPGGVHMPRVQGVNQGASQRMVVAPGFEHQGIFHMPGGQSGHPLSPFYRAGHAAWARGEPSPLLPGPSQYELRLLP